ncbi:MAG: cell wall-binding repeat-containing protein [Micrococcales bacterium]|nr:cell wall-binding repeat-containing protein [Micrococcales bacterium]
MRRPSRLLAPAAAMALVAATATAAPAGAIAPVAASRPAAVAATDGYDPVLRAGGANRYEVALSALQSTGLRPTLGVVASGETYADALPAGPAAAHLAAPVLLTTRTTLPSVVRTEVARPWYERFLVVGGPATIGSAVHTALATYGQVGSVSGANRVANAAELATSTFTAPVSVVHVASGAAFPDALSAGAAAARVDGPVLLTSPTALPAETRAALTALSPRRIVVTGGPASVSDAVVSALGAYASQGVTRVAGADRFEVSANLSAATFEPGTRVAYLASGLGFADALAGGPQAGLQGGPILLTRPDVLPASVRAELVRLQPRRIVVLGGTASVSDAVLASLRGLTHPAVAEDVSANTSTACALSAGEVECWGSGMHGALGLGARVSDVSVPVPVRGLGTPVARLAVGEDKACAVDTAGDVSCWGATTSLSSDDQLSAVPVAGLPAADSVAVGQQTACAVTTSGDVWCWGASAPVAAGGPGAASRTPRQVAGLPGPVSAVALGWSHACALTAAGEVWCWGSDAQGQTGTDTGSVVVPTRVDLGGATAGITTTAASSCAVLVAGGVRCWGTNVSRELGVASPAESAIPVTPTGLGTATGTLRSTRSQTCLVTGGTATCWGDGRAPWTVASLGTGLVSAQGACGLRATGVAVCATSGPLSGRVDGLPASTTGVRVTGY